MCISALNDRANSPSIEKSRRAVLAYTAHQTAKSLGFAYKRTAYRNIKPIEKLAVMSKSDILIFWTFSTGLSVSVLLRSPKNII